VRMPLMFIITLSAPDLVHRARGCAQTYAARDHWYLGAHWADILRSHFVLQI
jgi:hypothetical protein